MTDNFLQPGSILNTLELQTKLQIYLAQKKEVLFGYLFGSYARGTPKPGSDVDLAVYLGQGPDPVSYRLKEGVRLEEICGRSVDLIVMNLASPLLQHEIFRDGILLKETDHRFLTEYRVRNFYHYLDQVRIIDTIFNRNKERLMRGGQYGRSTYHQKKMNAILHHLERINRYHDISLEEFLQDEDIRDIVTHNLFITLQQIIDIGAHIIADAHMEEPSRLSDIPVILAKEKVIPPELASPLKAMIGLRNLIAHEYGEINFSIIYQVMTNHLPDIEAFLQEIIRYSRL